MTWTIHLIGKIAMLLTILGVVALLLERIKPPPKPKQLPDGLRTVIVAIELAETPQEANDILGEAGSVMRSYLRRGLYLDYIIIAFYWLLYLGFAALLTQQGWFIPGILVAVCITAAAQLDFLEDLNLFALLDTLPDDPNLTRHVDAVRVPSRVKWASIFVAVGLSGLVFLPVSNGWLGAVGAVHVLTGLVGLIGIWRYRPAVEWGYGLMSLAIILSAVVFIWLPEAFLSV